MPKPYPQEFRDDVVRVARNREPGTHLKEIAADFGISESCLTGWMKKADVEPPPEAAAPEAPVNPTPFALGTARQPCGPPGTRGEEHAAGGQLHREQRQGATASRTWLVTTVPTPP